jgi:hypothetical protein
VRNESEESLQLAIHNTRNRTIDDQASLQIYVEFFFLPEMFSLGYRLQMAKDDFANIVLEQ